MIVAAAVRLPARPDPYKPEVQDLILFVPAPGRHHNVLHSLHHNFKAPCGRAPESYAGEVQGFLTDKGEFLDRRAAYIHAQEHKQILRQPGGYQGDELFSEDLW
jgi:hypothetical protein